MPDVPQTYADHTRRHTPLHFFVVPVLLTNVVVAFVQLYREPGLDAGWWVVVPAALLVAAGLARLDPGSACDARRFRPKFLVETAEGVGGLVESGWGGRALRVGGVTLKCEMPAPRCSMTIRAQAGPPKHPRVSRTIVKEAGQSLGVYANVAAPGRVSAGDEVGLL